jgi:hypothetical protein
MPAARAASLKALRKLSTTNGLPFSPQTQASSPVGPASCGAQRLIALSRRARGTEPHTGHAIGHMFGFRWRWLEPLQAS